MKRLFYTLLMAIPLLLLAGCSREVETPTEGTLYKQYASQPALTVAELVGFRLDDSVTVDVVMVQADSDEAWEELKATLRVKSTEGSDSWLGNPENPALRQGWDGSAPVLRVVASHTRHTVGFYRIENEAQYDALIDYQLNHMGAEK